MPETKDKEFVAGLVIGALVGAGASLLLATEDGKVLRKKLKEKASQLLKEMPDLINDAPEKIDDIKDAIVEEAKEIISPKKPKRKK